MPDSIITDDMVGDALAYLGQEPHPIAVARGELTRAENNRKIVRARLFVLMAGKTIAEREAAAESHEDYAKAVEREAEAAGAYEGARAHIAWANAAIEVWRTNNANIRAAERVR